MDKLETATFAAGCFWCVEAVFQDVRGVERVASGYAGGEKADPTYEEVCTGTTGHAEAVQITFDPAVVSYTDLLDIFWHTHDPTTPNRQGADVGTQYRSAVFYHDEAQKRAAEEVKRRIEEERLWPLPIVTEIVPFTAFYPAEDYHQNYFKTNPHQMYCALTINPKVRKFRIAFREKLKNPGDYP
ncbi:MAG: peptide-methionine (S)-S-oxide reductase MsrA [Anaerolineales bacterium]|nr:peptide-methionine (S)-S-oxide reductase MsrA [Anaerolineales bacterium]